MNYEVVCIKCGKNKKLLPVDVTVYPQCEKCPKDRVKIPKRKAVVAADCATNKKKQKTLI